MTADRSLDVATYLRLRRADTETAPAGWDHFAWLRWVARGGRLVGLSASDLKVLIFLASAADRQTSVSYWSNGRIGEEMGLDPQTVGRAKARLAKRGLVRLERKAGPGNVDKVYLIMPPAAAGEECSPRLDAEPAPPPNPPPSPPLGPPHPTALSGASDLDRSVRPPWTDSSGATGRVGPPNPSPNPPSEPPPLRGPARKPLAPAVTPVMWESASTTKAAAAAVLEEGGMAKKKAHGLLQRHPATADQVRNVLANARALKAAGRLKNWEGFVVHALKERDYELDMAAEKLLKAEARRAADRARVVAEPEPAVMSDAERRAAWQRLRQEGKSGG